MVVYALLGGYDYEGYSLLGVYASREELESALEVYVHESEYGYDVYVLQELELGAPAGDVESELL